MGRVTSTSRLGAVRNRVAEGRAVAREEQRPVHLGTRTEHACCTYRGCPVSRTRRDSNQIKNTVLEIVKKDGGISDLFLNRKLDRNDIPETWLPERLCVRFGFCGEEYDSIPGEVNQNGRATVVFGWLIEKIALTSVILTEYNGLIMSVITSRTASTRGDEPLAGLK